MHSSHRVKESGSYPVEKSSLTVDVERVFRKKHEIQKSIKYASSELSSTKKIMHIMHKKYP